MARTDDQPESGSALPYTGSAWWRFTEAEAANALASGACGLSESEAQKRLVLFGPNTLPEAERSTWPTILLHQFASPLIYVLLLAMVVTVAIRHWADTTVIGIVLAVNAVVGFVQEHRAEHAMRALRAMTAPQATVRRGGSWARVPGRSLVPGDLVLLDAGDRVPADLRLLHASNLLLDEAILTGESVPVEKSTRAVRHAEDPPLVERVNMAYMGTTVSNGRARGLVVSTGQLTELGKIAQEIGRTERAETPLQRRTARFTRRVLAAVVLASAAVFAFGAVRGEDPSSMFLTAVTVAVSAMPEGLPVVMTVALAVSVRRMAQRHAIVRRLPAVETLGSCTLILTDKTGTLTENRMTVLRAWSGEKEYSFKGVGLEAHENEIEQNNRPVAVSPRSPLGLTLLGGLLNNTAQLRTDEAGAQQPIGDPTEVALLVAARKGGLMEGPLREACPTEFELPFDSARRYAASVHKTTEGEVAYVKGAPESVHDMCATQLASDGSETAIDRERANELVQRYADEGLRVLAIARGSTDRALASVRVGQPRELCLLGIVAMMDPPRPEVPEAVRACKRAGVRVLMVTGDHDRTAAQIARLTGIAEAESDVIVVTGADLDRMDDEQATDVLGHASVFSRVGPHQKLRLVKLLRARGEVVAVTGDGVNDAPALKSADIGASMGRDGTDVAKEASEIVLLDDNFATIYSAIEEGRTALSNLRKATFFLVSTGAAELLTIIATLLLGWPLPYLPAQILWLNVVTNGLEDVALAFEPAEPRLFRSPPRDPKAGLLDRTLVARTVVVGVVMALGTLGVFWWELSRDQPLAYAQVAALTVMVVFQILHVGSCRSESDSVFVRSPFSNPFLLIGAACSLGVHALAMHTGPLQTLLNLQPLNLESWLVISAVSLSVVAAVELHKLVTPRPDAQRRKATRAREPGIGIPSHS